MRYNHTKNKVWRFACPALTGLTGDKLSGSPVSWSLVGTASRGLRDKRAATSGERVEWFEWFEYGSSTGDMDGRRVRGLAVASVTFCDLIRNNEKVPRLFSYFFKPSKAHRPGRD